MWHQISQYIYAILLLPLQIIHNGSGDSITNRLPLWTWDCVNEHCVPIRAYTLDKLQSLETCNMLCAGMQLWPHPTGPMSLSNTPVPVRADLFQLQIITTPSAAVHTHVQAAFELFHDDLRRMERHANGFAEWRGVAVVVVINGSADPRMRLDTDESYNLHVHPKFDNTGPLTATITAKSFCGARHALETLLQLVWFDPYSGTLLMLEAVKILDCPRFKYRGLLIDTARSFFPIVDLMRTIDIMAASKLNTFHWHISDWHAFPLKVSSVPQFANYGAFGTQAVYTTEDVRKVVHRAKLRGIRVLIELSAPSHVGTAWSWGPSQGLNDLIMCNNINEWHKYCKEPPCGQLDPHNTHVYNILEALYAEIIHLTGVDDLFHLGGDDISAECWSKFNYKPERVVSLFMQNAFVRLDNANGKLPNLTILWNSPWSESIITDLRKFVGNLGLQIQDTDISAGTKKFVTGLRTVMSQASPWDLNIGTGEWFEGHNGMPYNSWQRMYEYRPWARGSGIAHDYVLGGEVTAWASQLSSGGLDARLWPRAAAFAERVWSDRTEGATRAVHVRFDIHRARLVQRGIKVSPLWSMYCSQYAYACG